MTPYGAPWAATPLLRFDGKSTGAVAFILREWTAFLTRGAANIQIHTGESVPDLPRILAADRAALLLCLALIGLALPGTGSAQQFCSEPVAPYCVDKDSEFDTMLQINRCEEDLNEYQQQLDEYEQCIQERLGALHDELGNARTALEEARKKF